MSVPIVRLGDPSSHGGSMVSASSVNLRANGLAVCVNGDSHACPLPGHGVTPVSSNSTRRSGGKSVIRVGDVAGCGAVITQGSPNVTTI